MDDLALDTKFWLGRRVLITGHTGFKGGWLAFWLKYMGANVTGYALEPPTTPNLFNAANIENYINHIHGDIRDSEKLKTAVKSAQPEVVFHLAAQPLVRRSYEDPVDTFETNVMGTLNIIEAVRVANCVCALVNVTSDKCYEDNGGLQPYREYDALGGYDPYSASKACAEIVSGSYRKSFLCGRVALATARAGNVIGGGDWGSDRLIPDIVRSFSCGQTAHVRNPKSIRPWQHVLDALLGYLLLAERLSGPDGQNYADAWNFGPGHDSEVTVEHIVTNVAALWDGKTKFEMSADSNDPHEAACLKLDSTKARSVLGWTPRWDLNSALKSTVTWYRAHTNQSNDLLNLMKTQLRKYEENSNHSL